ncbi:MAG: helix-turn-helix domain-containing protein [Candidatus Thorarchaeota archaeon]
MELPCSALTVFQALTTQGPLTPTEICKNTNLPDRTVSFALRKLVRNGLIQRIPNLRDMRSALYHPILTRAAELISTYGVESIIGSQLTILLKR